MSVILALIDDVHDLLRTGDETLCTALEDHHSFISGDLLNQMLWRKGL